MTERDNEQSEWHRMQQKKKRSKRQEHRAFGEDNDGDRSVVLFAHNFQRKCRQRNEKEKICNLYEQNHD